MYDELYAQLIKELNRYYSSNIQNTKMFCSLRNVRDNQFLFKLKMMLLGKKDYVIDTLKIAYEKLMISD